MPPMGSPATSVSATDYAFSPASMTVTAGETVTWTNNGSFAHTCDERRSGFANLG